MSEAQRNRPYLQHGSRHLPGGTDPILFAPLVAPLLPVATYVASAALPISSFSTTSKTIDLDTFTASTVADGSVYFTEASGLARLQSGYYLAYGFVAFNTVADWSAKTSFLSLAFETSHNYGTGFQSFQSTLSSNNTVLTLSVTDILNIPVANEDVWLAVGASAAISPLPSNLVVAKAAFMRLNGSI
jgi:hypothetical protein